MSERAPKLRTGMGFAATFGAICSVVFLGLMVGWATYVQINGAVIASGSVVVMGQPKSVQHLDGGIVQDIAVSDGDNLDAGTVLMRLDDTLLRANLEIYRNRLGEALARQARLQAEQRGAVDVVYNPSPVVPDDMDLSRHLPGQLDLFNARQEFQLGREEQLREKISQFENQIVGVEGLVSAKQDQLGFVEKELAATLSLNEKGLALDSAVLSLQRSRADVLGQVSEHLSELSRIGNSIRDTELEILQTARQFKEQAVTELREVTTTIEELVQQITSTEKQLDRIEIRAPVDGIAHELQFVTIGGVVPPGATIMQIIPSNTGVGFEMKVDPRAIDDVYIGQSAKVLFSAFNQRSTPELFGTVSGMSPTSIVDEVTGMPYFRVDVVIAPDELARLENNILVPGMPVEAFIQTQQRTVISYLTRPIVDQVQKAFKEE